MHVEIRAVNDALLGVTNAFVTFEASTLWIRVMAEGIDTKANRVFEGTRMVASLEGALILIGTDGIAVSGIPSQVVAHEVVFELDAEGELVTERLAEAVVEGDAERPKLVRKMVRLG